MTSFNILPIQNKNTYVAMPINKCITNIKNQGQGIHQGARRKAFHPPEKRISMVVDRFDTIQN